MAAQGFLVTGALNILKVHGATQPKLALRQCRPAGFERASENLGAAHCGHTASRGHAPVVCPKVLQMCKNGGGCPLPSYIRHGRGAQPPGDSRGLLNPADQA